MKAQPLFAVPLAAIVVLASLMFALDSQAQSNVTNFTNLAVRGFVRTGGDVIVGGDLVVSGDQVFEGAQVFSGDQTITGVLFVEGLTTVNAGLNVDGDAFVTGTLDVLGLATVDDLDVGGDITLAGALNPETSLTIGGNTSVDGNLEVIGELTVVASSATVEGELQVEDRVLARSVEWMGALITVSAELTDVVTVDVQLFDGFDDPLQDTIALLFYLEDDQGDIEATGPDGGITATVGQVIEPNYPGTGLVITDGDGAAQLEIEDSGAAEFYLYLVLPDGTLVQSQAITFATE